MSCDKDLSGTDLKVVEYSIVSVDPDTEHDDERLLYGPAIITTTDDMNDSDFTAWVIARYFQAPVDDPLRRRKAKIEHGEKQYLRVCYCVQCRMTIPDVNYQKTQANRLRDINKTLEGIRINTGGGQVGQGGQGNQQPGQGGGGGQSGQGGNP